MQGLFSNRPLLGAGGLTFALKMATLYVPSLNRIFYTEPLPLLDLAVVVGVSAVIFVAVETEKWVKRRVARRGAAPGR